MLLVGVVTYALFRDGASRLIWPALAIFVAGVWWLWLIPTYCDSVLRSNTALLCTRRVRGKLRGCEDHARDKRDAVFAILNMRNPGMIFRVVWAGPNVLPTATVAQAQVASNAGRDSWMLIFTVVGAVGSLLGAAFTAMS